MSDLNQGVSVSETRACVPQNCVELAGLYKDESQLVVTELSNDEDSNGQRLALSVVDGRPHCAENFTTIIKPVAWSDHASREFQQHRAAAIAEAARARVITVDFPGIGPESDPLTRSQCRDFLSMGGEARHFAVIGRLAWQAVQKAAPDVLQDDLVLFGQSQGASVVAGMMPTRPQRARIGEVVLWESEGLFESSVGSLAIRFFGNGSRDLNYYQSLNPEWVADDNPARLVPLMLTQARSLLRPVRAIARGTDGATLLNAHRDEPFDTATRLHIINGTKSTLSPTAANDSLAEAATRSGLDVRRVVHQGEYHGVQNALPFVAKVAQDIVRAQY